MARVSPADWIYAARLTRNVAQRGDTNVTVHESKVTSVQKTSSREVLPGSSVDQAEVRKQAAN